jgi:hypothetical protein
LTWKDYPEKFLKAFLYENILIKLHFKNPHVVKEECGDKVMVVYIDIYGNEFKEVLPIRKR